jgi:hypothetical protein
MKARIKTEMAARFRYYEAGWDNKAGKVIDLDDWGRQVEKDLWEDLDSATAGFEHAASATWYQEEAWVLEQFIQLQCRDFVGRTSCVNELLAFAHSPVAPEADWGWCVAGEAGSGKSSLFGEVARRLAREKLLLLTHAAGISSRSSHVETLLRRWSAELAAFLAVDDPSTAFVSLGDLERVFADLLAQVASRIRVVCLIDALDQFDPTASHLHLSWLPQSWPSNARLIVTARPGPPSAVFVRRQCRLTSLPPLGDMEAREILASVCRRYHRKLVSVP